MFVPELIYNIRLSSFDYFRPGLIYMLGCLPLTTLGLDMHYFFSIKNKDKDILCHINKPISVQHITR